MKYQRVQVEGLCIVDPHGDARLSGVTFQLAAGDALAVVGCSGAGKSTLARALLGELPPGGRYAAGSLLCCGYDVRYADGTALHRLRRYRCSWLGQDPASELTPTMTVRQLLTEWEQKETHWMAELLRTLDLPDTPMFLQCYPHQLSGGQRRRVALVRALLKRPALLILDEPFAGLDDTQRDRMRSALTRLRQQQGFALLLISHDIAELTQMVSHLLVMHRGRQVEYGPTRCLLTQPGSEALRHLLAPHDREWLAPLSVTAEPLLQVSALRLGYARRPSLLPPLTFQLYPGECVVLSGASGVGKSTLARALVGLAPAMGGCIRFAGETLALQVTQRPRWQQQGVALVPQDPARSLNPFRCIGDQLRQALKRYQPRTTLTVAQLLTQVGLPAGYAHRMPTALSGGEVQRVALARALAGQPKVLICDEVTSALDAPARRQIMQLLHQICHHHGVALLLITHDAHVLCHRRLILSPETGICLTIHSQHGDAVHDGRYRPDPVTE